MSRLDEIKARAEQVHWTSTSIEQAMARMASSAADVPWLVDQVESLERWKAEALGIIDYRGEQQRRAEDERDNALAEVARLTAEREWFKDRFPCDGVCVDAPEEACSRHGRSPADLWRIIGEVTAERDAQIKRAGRLERWYADALTMLDKSRRWKSIASLTAERDALAAQVARVEEVLDHWRTVDEGNAAYAERIGERSRFADGLASRADMLRAALADPEADTGAEEAGHRCEPYYSRAECGQCGWQEQWCVTCSRQMCGCATDAMGADQ